ncbi:MAG: polysaccharide deacetylase family protein [Bacillota bacterium]
MAITAGRRRRRLITGLTVVLLSAAILLLFHFDEPLRRRFGGVKPGVQLQGIQMEGLFRAEVAEIIEKIAFTEGRKPVDAVLDDARNAIVPELNGVEVDLEATIERIMSAEIGTAVALQYRQITPLICWDHYPSKPAYQGNARKAAVAFMINVAWGDEYLLNMLKVLEKEGARGTFFLTGTWAGRNEAMIRRMVEGGHEVGNHGYSDAEVFPELDAWAVTRSIRQTNEIIFDAVGRYPLYFTPHKGEFNDLTLELVSRQGMRTVLWTLDTVDWNKPGVAAMHEKIINRIGPGQIVLMHPTEDTVTLLELILPEIKERGLSVIRMEELFDPVWLGAPVSGVGK